MDLQAAQVDVETLEGFIPGPDTSQDSARLKAQVGELLAILSEAERPVIVAGNGIRGAGAIPEFRELIEVAGIPVLTTWLALDLLGDSHPLFAGRPGSIAPRGANFALQNSDLMLVIGSRLDMAFTGYAHDKLARGAKKILVDIDPAEIAKMKTHIHLPVVADAGDFLRETLDQLKTVKLPGFQKWALRCQDWKKKYPVVLDQHRQPGDPVSVYHLSEILSEELASDDIFVSGSSGSAVELFLLAFKVKEGQRVFHTRGLGAMGYGLPASIGACLGSGRRRTVCVDGDGGFQMNIQELETVRRLRLPIKFFVINNGGYASIRTSQKNYFKHLVAADDTSGLTLPDLSRVASSYGIATVRIENQEALNLKIRSVLEMEGPVVCEIISPLEEERAPRLSSVQRPDGSMVSKPLEDLWPFLDREEFLANMIIPPIPD
jgi:acetolactate synthase-1/2/3 large subunit